MGKPGVGEKIEHRVKKIEHKSARRRRKFFDDLKRYVTISWYPRYPRTPSGREILPACGGHPPTNPPPTHTHSPLRLSHRVLIFIQT